MPPGSGRRAPPFSFNRIAPRRQFHKEGHARSRQSTPEPSQRRTRHGESTTRFTPTKTRFNDILSGGSVDELPLWFLGFGALLWVECWRVRGQQRLGYGMLGVSANAELSLRVNERRVDY